MEYYKTSINDCLKSLNSSFLGLSDEDVIKSRELHGSNEFNKPKKNSLLLIFLKQFCDLLVIILIICAIISILTSNISSGLVIILVININAIIGTIETHKANKSLENIKTLTKKDILVKRNNKEVIVKETEIVVGDIVKFKIGDIICADMRIISCNNLEVDESQLSGESHTKYKNEEAIYEDKSSFDQSNMLFSGSKIINGEGIGVVCFVGHKSLIGNITNIINDTTITKSPLEKSLNSLSFSLAATILFICALVYIISVFQGKDIMESAMFAIALAVAAIPEALGSIVTICLAIGMVKMANNKAIVKNMKNIETLGSVSVICTDKTGTLTKNEMVVKKVFNGIDYENTDELLEAMLICNEIKNNETKGLNQTDKSLYEYAKMNTNFKKDDNKVLEKLSFNSNNKFMMVNYDGITYYKGAYEVLKKKIIYFNNRLLKASDKYLIEQTHDMLANEGLRVICFLKGTEEMNFIGFSGIFDSPKDDIYESIKTCHEASIKVAMITGDNKNTALSIGKMVGIKSKNVLTGEEISKLTDEELRVMVNDCFIYARTTPIDKLRLVNAYKANNEVVMMTGDGINDAPALKKADIGVSMASGMEISKDASDVILLDNDFKTITFAIKNGRNIYFNIRNAIRFLISGNMAGIIIAIYATINNFYFPFDPVQLLFINLLTDSLPAIAIGMEVANNRIMKYKPRNIDEKILNKVMIRKILFEGILIAFATIFSYRLGAKLLKPSMCFLTLCLARLFAGLNPRGEGSVFRYGIKNKWLLFSIILGVSLVNSVLFIEPLKEVFLVDDFTSKEILFIYLLAIMPTLIIQVLKYIYEGFKNEGAN